MAKKGFYPNPASDTKRLETKIDRQLDHDTRNFFRARRGRVKPAKPVVVDSVTTCDRCHKSDCTSTYVIRDSSEKTSRICGRCWKKRQWVMEHKDEWRAKKLTTAYDKYFAVQHSILPDLPNS